MNFFSLISILVVAGCVHADTFEGYDNPDSIDEGSCALPFPDGNVNLNFINEKQPKGGFYLGFNSKLEALKIAETILGRKITGDDDPRDYCARINWRTSDDGKWDSGKFSGFGKNETSVSCEKRDLLGNKHTCHIEKNGNHLFSADTYWTLTDQETYIVIVICTGNYGNKKLWNVISTKAVLDRDVKEKISAHVQSLGFSAEHFNTVDYSRCPN